MKLIYHTFAKWLRYYSPKPITDPNFDEGEGERVDWVVEARPKCKMGE